MKKISIKREQSQAGLSFAEREKFRPQVKNKLLLLLVLLMTAATGAWAQEPATTYSMKKLTVPDTWTGDMTTFSAADLPSDFAAVGDDVVTTIPAPTATGNAVLIYGFSGGETKYVEYANGVQSATDSRDFLRDHIYGYVNIMGYEGVYYTAAAGTSATYSVKMKDGVKDAGKWTVKVGEGEAQALPIGGLKGDGSETVTLKYTGRLKVKGVKATSEAPAEATPALSINSPSVGQVIGSDGKNYDYGSLPTGVTAVAKICYVSGSNGLALALTDEEGTMEWRPAMETIAAHTAPFTGGTWKVASKDEWSNMITAAGSYSALRDGFTSVGGTNMQSNYYWTSTEWDSNGAWSYNFSDGYWASDPMDFESCVRACLAFTVEQGGAAYTLLSAATTSDYGKVLCAAGHLHDAKTAVPDGCTAVGILGKVTETGYGLILALQDATAQTWNTINGWTSVDTYAGTTLKVLPDDAARGTNLTSYTKLGETAVSNWAVAQYEDYKAIFENLGSTAGDYAGKTYDGNVNAYITTGVGGTAISGEYWSATEYNFDVNCGWLLYSSWWDGAIKTTSHGVRPVLGFGGEAGEQAAKPAATVTTAPTGAAIVGVGKDTELVSGGVADGGTLMYAVTTTNTKPTSTAGFSDAVPTAQTIKASGTVYVWYYVKADDTHSDSEIAATAIEVPVADIVWDATNVSNLEFYGTDHYEKEGVTLRGNDINLFAMWSDEGIAFETYETGGFTFTAPTGKAFTKIEMKAVGPGGWLDASIGTGWAYNPPTVTWTGSAASTVKLLTDDAMFNGDKISCIVFYLSE